VLIVLTIAAMAWLGILAVVLGVCASAAAGDRALRVAGAPAAAARDCAARRHRTRPLGSGHAWTPRARSAR